MTGTETFTLRLEVPDVPHLVRTGHFRDALRRVTLRHSTYKWAPSNTAPTLEPEFQLILRKIPQTSLSMLLLAMIKRTVKSSGVMHHQDLQLKVIRVSHFLLQYE